MKELIHAAANFVLVPTNAAEPASGDVAGHAEVIIVCSEPKYLVDESGHVTRQRFNDTLRFGTSATGLRSLSEVFSKWADELDDFAAEHGFDPRAEPAAASAPAQPPPAPKPRRRKPTADPPATPPAPAT